MARFAIGDVQGCYDELRALLEKIRFSADRDVLWFVGDLVNRGPKSLEALRFVRSLRDNAIVVLGNHDLHLLALAYGSRDKQKSADTLDEIFSAPDRDELLEWLLHLPLAHFDSNRRDLLVHGGLIPPWSVGTALSLANEVQSALRTRPREVFDQMYGNKPDQWSETLTGADRIRFTINVLTRMRVCTTDGRLDLKMKGEPDKARPPFQPWFEFEQRRSRDVRVIFGHWSALGYLNAPGVLALDTGCVWGGALTAFNLDANDGPVSVPCSGYRSAESD
jgi:bis(5'-nucleosyl)-tetraphosphatase (symmetrical)